MRKFNEAVLDVLCCGMTGLDEPKVPVVQLVKLKKSLAERLFDNDLFKKARRTNS